MENKIVSKSRNFTNINEKNEYKIHTCVTADFEPKIMICILQWIQKFIEPISSLTIKLLLLFLHKSFFFSYQSVCTFLRWFLVEQNKIIQEKLVPTSITIPNFMNFKIRVTFFLNQTLMTSHATTHNFTSVPNKRFTLKLIF